MPGNPLTELHVGADAVDVLRGVEGGRLGVAVDDRLVDHPVLGGVDAGAAGHGDRVVAQPVPERLVHQLGDVVGEGEQHGVAGHRRQLAVEEAVRRAPGGDSAGSRPPWRRAGSPRPRRAVRAGRPDGRPRARAARGPPARPTGSRRAGPQRPRARRRPRTFPRRAGLDHALDLERGDRLAHRGAAHLERAGQLALRRQPLAGRLHARADVGRQALSDLLVALEGTEGGSVGGQHRTQVGPLTVPRTASASMEAGMHAACSRVGSGPSARHVPRRRPRLRARRSRPRSASRTTGSEQSAAGRPRADRPLPARRLRRRRAAAPATRMVRRTSTAPAVRHLSGGGGRGCARARSDRARRCCSAA